MTTARLREEVARLRQRTRPARPLRSERETLEDWQLREIPRRNREIPGTVKVCRSRLGWLRMTGQLSGFTTAEALVDDIMTGPDGSGSLLPPSERSRVLVSREVYLAVWRGDPGLGHLEPIPAEWVEILDAAETWRERLQSVPPATFARWVLENRRAMQEHGSEAGQIEALGEQCLWPFGITEALLESVVGPDRDALTSEELGWQLNAPLQDLFVSEWAFEVQEEVRKIDEREGGN
jgi:hypothetical protein